MRRNLISIPIKIVTEGIVKNVAIAINRSGEIYSIRVAEKDLNTKVNLMWIWINIALISKPRQNEDEFNARKLFLSLALCLSFFHMSASQEIPWEVSFITVL